MLIHPTYLDSMKLNLFYLYLRLFDYIWKQRQKIYMPLAHLAQKWDRISETKVHSKVYFQYSQSGQVKQHTSRHNYSQIKGKSRA